MREIEIGVTIGLVVLALIIILLIVFYRRGKGKAVGIISGILVIFGFICVIYFEAVIKDGDKNTKSNDSYYGSEQYYKDAHEYYKDKDNWNNDYGDKYGHRLY